MGRPMVVIELATDVRLARDLAAGGVFVPSCELAINAECDLVIRGAGDEMCVPARVVFVDAMRGAGLELVGFGAQMREHLAALVSSVAAGEQQQQQISRDDLEEDRALDRLFDEPGALAEHGPARRRTAEGSSGGLQVPGGVAVGSSGGLRFPAGDDGGGGGDDDDDDAAYISDRGFHIDDLDDAPPDDGDRVEAAGMGAGDAGAGDAGAGDDGAGDDAGDDEPGDERRGLALNHHQRLRGLTLAQQIKKAHSSDPGERIMLERMYGKNVWEALLRNPRLTAPEVARIARMGTLPRTLLEIIVGNGGWLQIPEIRRALLANPRLGNDQVLRVLRLLPKHELKLAAVQTAYPHAVRDIAKRLLRELGG